MCCFRDGIVKSLMLNPVGPTCSKKFAWRNWPKKATKAVVTILTSRGPLPSPPPPWTCRGATSWRAPGSGTGSPPASNQTSGPGPKLDQQSLYKLRIIWQLVNMTPHAYHPKFTVISKVARISHLHFRNHSPPGGATISGAWHDMAAQTIQSHLERRPWKGRQVSTRAVSVLIARKCFSCRLTFHLWKIPSKIKTIYTRGRYPNRLKQLM